MRRIALVGCSHTDYFSELPNKQDHWSFNLLDFSVTVDNYARHGQSNGYIEFVLRYILANQIQYDCVIVQTTGPARWMFPVTDSDQGLNIATREVAQGYNHKQFDSAWGYTSDPVDQKVYRYLKNNKYNTNVFNPHNFTQDTNNGNDVASYYSNVWKKSLWTYQHVFENFFYWDYQWSSHNNIGHADNFQKTAIQNLGETQFADLNFDSMHLNPQGHKYLWDNYIYNSKIGEYLND